MKRILKTVVPLILFIGLIYLAYSFLFTNTKLKEARQEIQAMDHELMSVIDRLDHALISLDSAMSRLEDSREEIGLLRKQANADKQGFETALDTTYSRLKSLQDKMIAEREEIRRLQARLKELDQ